MSWEKVAEGLNLSNLPHALIHEGAGKVIRIRLRGHRSVDTPSQATIQETKSTLREVPVHIKETAMVHSNTTVRQIPVTIMQAENKSTRNHQRKLSDPSKILANQSGCLISSNCESVYSKMDSAAEAFNQFEKEFERFASEAKVYSKQSLVRTPSRDRRIEDSHNNSSALHIEVCKIVKDKTTASPRSYSQSDREDTDSGYSGSGHPYTTLSNEDIYSRIQAYNERHSGKAITQAGDAGLFQGFVQICLCIERPIQMRFSARPVSIFDALKRDDEQSQQSSPENTLAPVLLPRNTSMGIHINSKHTAQEVVNILLSKFKMTANPRNFALFEQTLINEREVKLRRIADSERPLLNYLKWCTEDENLAVGLRKRLVLKETDGGEIMWEAFSIPELNNFLRMLDHEEAEYLKELQHKYFVWKKHLQTAVNDLRRNCKPD